VHLALQEEAGVRTSSEGDGEERQVVVHPAIAV
jgi:predicted RNA-binding protein Jag